MARFGIGPVRFGGGRRVSVTGRVGPFSATFGGRYKKRRSGGRDPVDGQPLYNEAEDRAADQMIDKLWAEYCDFYRSLTPKERSVQDHWNWEVEQFFIGISSKPIRLTTLTYLFMQFLVLVLLLDLSAIGWLVVLGLSYLGNRLFVSYLSAKWMAITRRYVSSEFTFWLSICICALIVLTALFILRAENRIVSLLIFSILNYLVFVSFRHAQLRTLRRQLEGRKEAHEILATHGYLQNYVRDSVWYSMCAAHFLLHHAEKGRYFALTFWFPYIHLKRILKGNRLGMMPYLYVDKTFAPFPVKMPKKVPYSTYPHLASPFLGGDGDVT